MDPEGFSRMSVFEKKLRKVVEGGDNQMKKGRRKNRGEEVPNNCQEGGGRTSVEKMLYQPGLV